VDDTVSVRFGVCTGVDVGIGVLSGGGVFTQPDKTATANIIKKTFSLVVKMNPPIDFIIQKKTKK